jgi:hypothetical protein
LILLVKVTPDGIVDDRRLNPLAAVAYVNAVFTPEATDADRAVGQGWRAERSLGELCAPARRSVAAYWSFAQDDQRLWQ